MVKATPEQISRRNLLNTARKLGFEHEVLEILKNTDEQMKRCTDPVERKQIALYGIVQIDRIFGSSNTLEVDGKIIY